MPSLRELQQAFANALLSADTAGIEPLIAGRGIEPAERLRIYRNNLHQIFLDTLRAAFPVLERLVGIEYFREMAAEFQQHHPSDCGDRQQLGRELPEFLQRRLGTSDYSAGDYRYLPDVARLEWAYQEVLVAAEHAPLDLARLARVNESEHPRLVFRLHPAARLIESRFPVLTIWSANQADRAAEEAIDLGVGGERVLLLRTAHDVELRGLESAEFTFLSALNSGATLAAAAERVAGSPDFDLGATLRHYVGARALVDFVLADTPT